MEQAKRRQEILLSIFVLFQHLLMVIGLKVCQRRANFMRPRVDLVTYMRRRIASAPQYDKLPPLSEPCLKVHGKSILTLR